MFRLISVLTFLLFIITIASYLGEFNYRLELLANFKFQYFLLFLLSAGFYSLWVRRKSSKVWFSLALIGIGLNAWAIAPFYLPHHQQKSDSPTELRYLLANVLTSNTETTAFIEQVKNSKADVVSILEVNAKWASALKALESDYPFHFVIPQDDNFGIALYSKHPLNNIKTLNYVGKGLPSITADAVINGKTVSLITTHTFPPISEEAAETQQRHFQAMTKSVDKNAVTILAGDLNATPWSNVYKQFKTDTGLYNSRLGKGLNGTWPETLFSQIPIDHILLSPTVYTKSVATLKIKGSDHLALLVELSF